MIKYKNAFIDMNDVIDILEYFENNKNVYIIIFHSLSFEQQIKL